VKRIREKLGVGNKAELTQAAMLRLLHGIHPWDREARVGDVA
jgi:hypothetical protein